MKALLGSAASAVSPLALPWGGGACYMQTPGQRRGGKATLVKERVPAARHSLVVIAVKGASHASNFTRVSRYWSFKAFLAVYFTASVRLW